MGESETEDEFIRLYMSLPWYEQKLFDVAEYIHNEIKRFGMNRLSVLAGLLVLSAVGVGIAIYSKNPMVQMSACFAAGGATVAVLMLLVYRYFMRH